MASPTLTIQFNIPKTIKFRITLINQERFEIQMIYPFEGSSKIFRYSYFKKLPGDSNIEVMDSIRSSFIECCEGVSESDILSIDGVSICFVFPMIMCKFDGLESREIATGLCEGRLILACNGRLIASASCPLEIEDIIVNYHAYINS